MKTVDGLGTIDRSRRKNGSTFVSVNHPMLGEFYYVEESLHRDFVPEKIEKSVTPESLLKKAMLLFSTAETIYINNSEVTFFDSAEVDSIRDEIRAFLGK